MYASELLGYVLICLGPAAAWFAWSENPLGTTIAVLVTMYLAVLCVVGARHARGLSRSFALASENARLVTDLRRAAAELSAGESRLSRIIDLIPFPVFAKDGHGHFVLANRATAEALGTSRERLLTAEPNDLGLDPDELRTRLAEDRAIIATGRPSHVSQRVFTEPGGRVRISETNKIPLPDPISGETLVLGVAVDITERKAAEREALHHKALMEAILQNLPVCIYRRVRHPDGSLSYPFISTSQFGTFKYDAPRQMHEGNTFLETIHPDDRASWQAAVDASGTYLATFDHEFRIIDETGEVRWVRGLARPHGEADGTVVWDGLELDITESKQVEAALLESEERFRSAFDNAPVGMVLVRPDRAIIRVNRTFCDMLGYAEEELVGHSINDVTHPEDVSESDGGHRTLFGGEVASYTLEKRYVHREGHVVWAVINVSLVRDDTGDPLYGIAQVRDVTESRRMSEELSYQATHDALTGLVNRTEFESRLQRVIRAAAASGSEHALCYLDLDQFKIVNDTCGHIAGDELLRQLAGILAEHVRARDTVARLGGDEFAVLLEHCTVEQANRVADEMREAVAAYRLHWEDKSFALGASIGLVPIDAGSGDVTDVLRAADAACYVAKDAGRNRIHLYRSDDADLEQRRGEIRWVERLGRAIDENRLRLMAQPIEPLGTGSAMPGSHVEILLRLEDESGELVPPGAFLPAAERYDMAERIDRWVLGAVLDAMEAAGPEAPAMVAVNLSGQSVGSEAFHDFLATRLAAAGPLAGRLCFEITETAAITHLTRAASFMGKLKGLGCSFALDDFGSGLSSFGYLKTLPVDYLKIDGSFVRDVLDDPMSLAIVRSINEIGHVLGKLTVAEFVENDAVRARLVELGVDFAQGYCIGRPVPAHEYLPPREPVAGAGFG
jgi:diguanylate cyclase (GGDEF)-like protein/PAS domain S-box-containing protein